MELRRLITESILDDLRYTPAVGIVGPRQVGKTTLARQIVADGKPHTWFDLQRPQDYRKLENAELLLPTLADQLAVIDEIQLMPELFGLLRPLIDADRRPGRFLLLGSASPALIRGASESLAGRVSYSELTPLSLAELRPTQIDMNEHLVFGGYPEPLLGLPLRRRGRWYDSFVKTYVTRDLQELGRGVVQREFETLLQMLAHANGALFNASTLAKSLTVKHDTVRRYVDLLEGSFLLRRLRPYLHNSGKRLVKSPRLYLRDSGLLHHLLGIDSYTAITGHIGVGHSWEGYVIEEICRVVGDRATPYFYRTASGAELDLVLDFRRERWAFEIKFSNAPKLTRGFYSAVEDVTPSRTYVVTPGADRYEERSGAVVIGLAELLGELG